MSDSSPTFYLGAVAGQSPLLIAYIAGMILVISRWRNHPRPSKLAFFGLATLFLNVVVMELIYRLGFEHLTRNRGWNPFTVIWIENFVRCAVTAVGILLLLFAVYTSRLPQAARRAERVRDMDFPFDRPSRPFPKAVPVEERESAIRERKE
jgi:hypothetical protein